MTTALQNKAWSILPKEFKEEVKKEYLIHHEGGDMKYSYGYSDALTDFFGEHNLTSDAEGEVELLHVTRQKVMGLYANAKKLHDLYTNATCINEAESRAIDSTAGTMSVLKTLFGSKCLPDEDKECSNPSVVNCKHKHGDGTCSLGNMCCHKSLKPAEPKFKVGDKVKDISSPHDDGIYKVDDIKKSSDGFLYHIQGLIGQSNVKESDLEPYTEPSKEYSATLHAESVKESRIANEESYLRNLSQETANCDKHFDRIVKDGFSKERRLNIAAMVIASIMGSNDWSDYRGGTDEEVWHNMAKASLGVADALIKEAEKGNSDGED